MREQERWDRIDVADLILRERLARDSRQWDEMAACYHPQSVVEVSWLRGSGAEFVEMTKKAMRPNNVNFHIMTPPVVNVRGDRATSETPCILRSFSQLSELEVSFQGFVRLFWRARRDGGEWLIAGLRCLYMKDELHGRHPGREPSFDEEKLAGYRDSYRYTSANLANLGIAVKDDMPGIDRPEMVAALREGEAAWLVDGSTTP